MSVLIKGMEMPKNCKECRFCFYDRKYEPMCLLLNGKRGKSDCPLVEIPPHGRLIDADAFTKDECNNCDGACEALPCDCLNCESDCRCDFMKDIADAPTVIEAEEGE